MRRRIKKPNRINLAVVGGSFSGLALARMLERTSNFQVSVFEARSEEATKAEINGSIYMHGGEELLRRLGLSKVWENLVDTPGSGWISKQNMISSMENSLVSGTVQYNSQVTKIQENSDGTLSCMLRNCPNDGTTTHFDFVVVANGLTSSLRWSVPLAARNRVALIGDARRQFGREPYLGALRINFGSTRALWDALNLADVLIHGDSLRSFSLQHWHQTRTTQTRIAIVAAISFLIFSLYASQHLQSP